MIKFGSIVILWLLLASVFLLATGVFITAVNPQTGITKVITILPTVCFLYFGLVLSLRAVLHWVLAVPEGGIIEDTEVEPYLRPLSRYQRRNFLVLPSEKTKVLIELANKCQQRIYIVAGELNEEVFGVADLGRALYNAAIRGVDMQIISGDRDTSKHPDDFLESLFTTNPHLMREITPAILEGKIKMFFGTRPQEHFHVFDNAVIYEEKHQPRERNIWELIEDAPTFMVSKFVSELEVLRDKMNFVDKPCFEKHLKFLS